MDSGSGRRRLGRAETAITGLALAAGAFLLLGEDTEASMLGLAFVGLVVGG